MDELSERAEMQLRAIEMSYSINILNRAEIVRLLSERLKDKRQILWVCTSISSWIAAGSANGDTVVPINLVLKLIEAVSHDIHRG
ncbi:MAG TPA: hypothetical protein PKK11_08675 [Methanothrix sp.]|nr:hypothetical protein [Methanothrix sp.]HPT20089.1 hypothetical protein [Methanothrix sp.]